ncbi:hypothetical protein D9757_006287 [Collybiopsis confluens]|uniref:Uncharacterized protein n=1 Tax=Collybiopsis confluens TaxID=2823264 RepID=A0A8H5HG72_9AGAR|nr:hypothetical protein D9757_006287 [Collybiopsis confluens]
MASLISPRPFASSPLAGVPQRTGSPARPGTARRNPSFPPSRALRPFPSIANTLRPTPTSSGSNKKPIKLIQPPLNQPCVFTLNLTQAELSRQD